jgi:hypothetical protein
LVSDVPHLEVSFKRTCQLFIPVLVMSFKTTKLSKESILRLMTKLFHGALNEEIKYPTIERFITASTFSKRPAS